MGYEVMAAQPVVKVAARASVSGGSVRGGGSDDDAALSVASDRPGFTIPGWGCRNGATVDRPFDFTVTPAEHACPGSLGNVRGHYRVTCTRPPALL
ncbi:MAG: hypothetical protein ACYDC5_03980 [Candidatus Dormibacteria bacterium]